MNTNNTINRSTVEMTNGSIYSIGFGVYPKNGMKKNHVLLISKKGIEYVVNLNNKLAYKSI
jgi:hypothetical protein